MGTVFGVLIAYYVLSGNMSRDLYKWSKKDHDKWNDNN